MAAVSCTASNTCEAVGSYRSSSGTQDTLGEVWNGTAWKHQSTPNPTGATGSYLDGVSCTAANACEAVGSYLTSTLVTLAQVWNGTAWKHQSTPNPTSATYSLLDGVSCTAANACEAIGNYYNSSGPSLTLAESKSSRP
jgi:hypothetical protein